MAFRGERENLEMIGESFFLFQVEFIQCAFDHISAYPEAEAGDDL